MILMIDGKHFVVHEHNYLQRMFWYNWGDHDPIWALEWWYR
jgi:hypothetical protein